jgi:hypothetical protein
MALRRRVAGSVGLALRCPAREPDGLGIDLGQAHPAALAPGAREGAGGAAEVRDHSTGAATGHTLPRPLGRLGLILAVVCLARHEPMRLAFCA